MPCGRSERSNSQGTTPALESASQTKRASSPLLFRVINTATATSGISESSPALPGPPKTTGYFLSLTDLNARAAAVTAASMGIRSAEEPPT